MPLRTWFARSEPQPGAPGFRAVAVSRAEWRELAQDVAATTGGWLAALWASESGGHEARIHAVYLVEHAGLAATLALDQEPYPALDELFPAAARMQRAVRDLSGIHSTGQDARPWLRHSAWPPNYRPLVEAKPALVGLPPVDDYAFIRVEGEGVHEIPVGPVHAGVIEPGHFRFSVVGEKVLRLEERLGYVHKGIERRFTEIPALEGHRLAARVSGDSAVAFSWAYCQAFEGLCSAVVSPRAQFLRALCLEIERIQNHLGDLGALGNDAGFAFGLAQFWRLKEEWVRAVEAALGQRYLLDVVVPGGVAVDLTAEAGRALAQRAARLAQEVRELREIYDAHDRSQHRAEIAPRGGESRRIQDCGQHDGQHQLRLGVQSRPVIQEAEPDSGQHQDDWVRDPHVCKRQGCRQLRISRRELVRFTDLVQALPHMAYRP